MSQKSVFFTTTLSLTVNSFAVKQLKMLAQKGYKITVACSDPNELEQSLSDCVRTQPVRINRGFSLKGTINSIIDYSKLFKDQEYDLVMYATPNAAFSCSIAAKLCRVPVRLYCQWGIRYVGFTDWKRKLFKLIEKITCFCSTHVEPISFGNLDFGILEKLYPKQKGYVVGRGGTHGVDLNVFNISKKLEWRQEIRNKYAITEGEIIFGFVGRITRDKGLNEIFEATRSLVINRENVKLLLIGPVEDQNGLDRGLVNWAETESRVVWCGETNMVEKYMAAMDVLLFPTYREGFGQVSVEAQAMGIPVITTDIPGPRDSTIADKSALLIEPQNASELLEAMKKLLDDKEMRIRMGQYGIDNVRANFDDKVFLNLLLQRRKGLLGI